jgi:endonuclease-3 related protein
MNRIEKIYSLLYAKFKAQHWWPVTKENETAPKYHRRIKLSEKHKLEIIFGAILTQNTSWKNVEKAIINLSKRNLINARKINAISTKKLAAIIRPAGYYNQKAKKLKNFSSFLLRNYNGSLKVLFEKGTAELREELLSVNGIGKETADSITLYAAEKPIFVIDAYTKRIYSRIFGIRNEIGYDELQRVFEKSLKKDTQLFKEYHALLVELGKNYCKNRKPLCGECPLKECCTYKTKIFK